MITAPEEVKVVQIDPQFVNAFADLNYPWIEESYGIEPHDHEILDHPIESVIEPGGEIFFAVVGEEVAGTVAMIRMDEDRFELAKMAVSPKSRGRGIGDKLM